MDFGFNELRKDTQKPMRHGIGFSCSEQNDRRTKRANDETV